MIREIWPSMLKGLMRLGIDLLIIVVIFLLAKVAIDVISKITGKTMEKANDINDKEKSQQLKTSMTLTHSANRYVIYLIAIILSLKVLGLGEEVSSAIVAAGVGGLIISLGAQSIVKDMIAGLFLLFERQFYVGDHVKIGQYEGTVTSIALRVTYLLCSGKRVIIPNGEIKDVVNYSRSNNVAVIKVPTPYEADTRKVMSVIQNVADKYYKDNKKILTDKKPQVLGVDSFSENGVIITVTLVTKPLKCWEVQRDLMLLIKEEFKKKKINIPHEKTIVYKK